MRGLPQTFHEWTWRWFPRDAQAIQAAIDQVHDEIKGSEDYYQRILIAEEHVSRGNRTRMLFGGGPYSLEVIRGFVEGEVVEMVYARPVTHVGERLLAEYVAGSLDRLELNGTAVGTTDEGVLRRLRRLRETVDRIWTRERGIAAEAEREINNVVPLRPRTIPTLVRDPAEDQDDGSGEIS
jgi:hypothetical protein